MGKPAWLGEEKPTTHESQKQEKRLAKKIGGRTTAGSGATRSENDVYNDAFDIEAKTTAGKGYRITVAELEKAERRAKVGRIPIHVIEFREAKREIVVMRMEDFEHMTNFQRSENQFDNEGK